MIFNRASKQIHARYWFLGLASCFVFLLTLVAPVTQAPSDPLLSLVVSQAIVEQGTIKLDGYYSEDPTLFQLYRHQTIRHHGNLYYAYPLAPSLFAVPAVWLARQMGLDMRDIPSNHAVQQSLAAILCALIFGTMGLIAFSYLPARSGLAITAVTMLGSALISSLGVALWNLSFAALFISLGLLLIARYENGQSQSLNGYLLGLLLFFAYLSRPSVSIFILIVFGYLALKDRLVLVKTAVTAFCGFLLFVLFSQLEYGQWLPFYYTSSTWFHSLDIAAPLYGLTFGPARGLFIFSPFFLLPVIGGVYYFSALRRAPLFWLCAFWISLQTITIATTRQWWGGFSFGPRLLTDALPALFMMTLILWQAVRQQISPQIKRSWAAAYLILGLIGIVINSGQGLFSVKTNLWSAYPNIDLYPEYLFEWRYPQFWMTAELFHERREWHYLRLYEEGRWLAQPYEMGERLTPSIGEDDQAAFIGWNALPDQTQGTEIQTPKLIFTLDEVDPDQQYWLDISAHSFGPQRVAARVNGQAVGQVVFNGPPQTERFLFDGRHLRAHDLNIIEFNLPHAAYPTLTQLRQYGRYFIHHRLGLHTVIIHIYSSN
jgi:hypothetical protein